MTRARHLRHASDPLRDRVLLWVAAHVPSTSRRLCRLVDDHRMDRTVAERARLARALRSEVGES